MNKIFISTAFFFCLQANAGYECDITYLSKGKKPDFSKLELKQDKKNKTLFSAEQNGFIFEILRNETDSSKVEKLMLTEKASTRKSMAFGDWKTDNPNTPFGTALLEGQDGGERSGARMVCKTTKL